MSRTVISPARTLVLTLLVLLFSCHESITLPPVKGPPLKIPERGSGASDASKPLAIVYHSPKGQLSSAHTQLTVTFNKPMVALEKVEDRAAKAPLTIEPAVPGKQRWLGSRALTFLFDKELPGSTTFLVKLAPGVKALDGSTLSDGLEWSFSTPRLKVSRSHPYRGTRWAKPNQPVRLYFNQPVTPEQVQKHAAFFATERKSGESQTIPARVRRLGMPRSRLPDPKGVLVEPATPLPLDARVTLKLAGDLIGRDGPLPMKEDWSTSFTTYGPLRLVKLGCTTKCDPDRSVRVALSNPVPRNAGRGAIRVGGQRFKPGRSSYRSAAFYLDAKLRPRRKYTVKVAGSLRDIFGQRIAGNRELRFETRDFDPYARLPIASGVVEARTGAAAKRLPLSFRNARSAKLLYKALGEDEVARLLAKAGFDSRYDAKPMLHTVAGVKTKQLRAKGPRNARVVRRVDLTKMLGAKGRGLLALELVAKLDDKQEVVQRALVRITDLAMTAKFSPHGSLVWITSLASGKPVAGAEVAIWRPGGAKPLWQGQADKSGLVSAPGTLGLGLAPRDRSLLFFAKAGGDQSFVVSSSTDGLSSWLFGYDETWDAGAAAVRGLVFSDRGIYRPGDTVRLKGLLRQQGKQGLARVEGVVEISIDDARGEALLSKRRLELSEFGSFDLAVPLPHAAPLGRYSIVVKPKTGGAVHGDFRVEEYRPAEFAVSAKSDRREYVRGDQLAWSATARYLFGAPMRLAKHRYSIYRSSTSFSPPGHPGFVFADEVSWWGSGRRGPRYGGVARGQGKLDERGATSGNQPLRPARMRGAERYKLEVTVTDVSRQSISARTAVTLHPGEFYIGVKPDETFIRAGEALGAAVIASDAKGKRVAGATIEGTLYRRTWQSVRKKGMGGSHYFVSRPVETKVVAAACRVVTKARGKPGRCEAKVAQAGYYVLRLRARDKRGNALLTSIGVYATGADYVPWRRGDQSKVELVTDRKLYKVGQRARIMIKSPFANAHGLLTVEGNGIHLRRPLLLKRTAAWVEVPINAELVPNAFVSVMLVRGRVKPTPPARKGKGKGKREDAGHEDANKPVFKVGYTKLTISQRDRRLKVDVTPDRKQYRPGDKVTVKLRVRDRKGRGQRAELAVIAADEGVLSLIGYKTPDPMKIFYAHRGLSVRTADNRNQLINPSVFGQKGGNPGGGGAGMGSRSRPAARSRFVSTPLFAPSVVTDDRGQAEVSFTLPDNLTTFRIMAVAASPGAEFGNAEAKVTVNKPLLLLSTLPRLLRVGDTIEAGVVVHNHSQRDGEVEVRAGIKGLAMIGPRLQRVRVESGGAAEARFRFGAKRPGTATFRFDAKLGDFGDAVKLERPVKLPLVIEAVATAGSTESAVAEGIVPGDGVRDDAGGLEVTLASSALVGLKGGFDYLLDYPYECVEQTTSRLVPLVLLKDLTAAFGLETAAQGKQSGKKASSKKQVGLLVDKLIAKLQTLQRWDGGFAYWPSSHKSAPWASAYAAWGLLQAKKGGHAVSERVLKKAQGFLKKLLRRKGDEHDRGAGLDTKAFAAHVLVKLGDKPSGYLARLYDKREGLAVFSKALLLSAMIAVEGDKQAIGKLTDELTNHVHQTGKVAKVEENLGDGYAPLFHSNTRSTAMVLEALLLAKPDHPLVDKLVAYLARQRKDGRWRNTQETVYALLGMHRYYEVRERQPPDFLAKVVLGQRKLLERRFSGRSLQVQRAKLTMKQLRGGGTKLGFVKEGPGRLHYTARLRYARKELPKTAWDEGFFVTRTYERIDEGAASFDQLRGTPSKRAASAKQVRAGDLVRVTLRIIAPQQMHFVAVEDPLPAGLEAVNFQLMTAAQSLRRSLRHSSRSSYGRRRSSRWHTPFYHREMRDDRVQLFADSMSPGEYTYVYLARATTIGEFVAPPTRVEQMYEPEVFGRTGATTLSVVAQ